MGALPRPPRGGLTAPQCAGDAAAARGIGRAGGTQRSALPRQRIELRLCRESPGQLAGTAGFHSPGPAMQGTEGFGLGPPHPGNGFLHGRSAFARQRNLPKMSPAFTTRSIRVLIVDDSAFMRTALSRMIASEAGLEVAGTASSGSEALDKIAALDPDVITLDVEMPGLDGLQTLRRIMLQFPRP